MNKLILIMLALWLSLFVSSGRAELAAMRAIPWLKMPDLNFGMTEGQLLAARPNAKNSGGILIEGHADGSTLLYYLNGGKLVQMAWGFAKADVDAMEARTREARAELMLAHGRPAVYQNVTLTGNGYMVGDLEIYSMAGEPDYMISLKSNFKPSDKRHPGGLDVLVFPKQDWNPRTVEQQISAIKQTLPNISVSLEGTSIDLLAKVRASWTEADTKLKWTGPGSQAAEDGGSSSALPPEPKHEANPKKGVGWSTNWMAIVIGAMIAFTVLIVFHRAKRRRR